MPSRFFVFDPHKMLVVLKLMTYHSCYRKTYFDFFSSDVGFYGMYGFMVSQIFILDLSQLVPQI